MILCPVFDDSPADLPAVESDRVILPPWVENSYGLVSWWDMEKFAAERFCNITDNLSGIACEITKVSHITPGQSAGLRGTLANLIKDCESIGLKVAALQVQVVIDRLANYSTQNIPSPLVSQMLDDLNAAIACEMQTHLFMWIYPQRAEFWEQSSLFGDSVNMNFQSAKEDIKEAGCCYATDRNTACVMHLMRVLEVGLSALATDLKVTFDRRNWENIINDIEAEIKKINGPTWGPNWKQRQQFYSGAAKDFRYFKDAWRNHAMHFRERYDHTDAKSILEHVKAFMMQLADDGLKE